MAKEIFSTKTDALGRSQRNRYLSLIQDRTSLTPKPFHEVGMQFAQFTGSQHNSIPTAYAQEQRDRLAAGKKLTGPAALMLDNAHALIESSKKRGTFNESKDWYPKAHEFAQSLARKHGVGVEQTSGVIAALSGGGGEWEANKRNADKLIGMHNAGVHHEITPQNFHGVESTRLSNAIAIMQGQHPLTVLGNMKEGNFFQNIHDPSNSGVSTQDTQMSFGLKGWKKPWRGVTGGASDLQQPAVYGLQHDITAAAGRAHGLEPNQAQPVMWDEVKALTPKKAGFPVPQSSAFGEYFDTSKINPRFHTFSGANSRRDALELGLGEGK